MNCYVCLEAPFTPRYPLALGRQLLAQTPPRFGVPLSAGCSVAESAGEEAAAFARRSLSLVEGTVPAGSLEEELEEAPRKAHERGSLPARASALCWSTSAEPGMARTAPLLRVQECLRLFLMWMQCHLTSCFWCISAVLAGLQETRERCVSWGELMFELKPVSPSRVEQDRPRHAWGEVVTASLLAPARKPDRRNFSHLAVVMLFFFF